MIATIVNRYFVMIIEEHYWEIRNGPPIKEQSLILEPNLNLLLIAAELHFGTFQKDAHTQTGITFPAS